MAGYEGTPWLYKTCEIKYEEKDAMSDTELISIICDSVRNKKPFCISRYGDGEITVMSQDLALTQEWLRKNVAWYDGYTYCGVKLPDYDMRDRLIQAAKDSDAIGVFFNDAFIDRVFSSIHFKHEKYFYAFANVYFCYKKEFVDLIKENPPIVVGRNAKRYSELLKKELGVTVPGYYTEITCPKDIEPTMDWMESVEHDWALVSAGCNANIICTQMKKRTGKVYIDLGQGTDTLLDPKYEGRYYFYKEEK